MPRLTLLAILALVVPISHAATSVSDARYSHLARGINLTRWFQYGGRVPITASDRDMLQSAGFTAVRIVVAPQYLLPKWASERRRTRTLTNLDTGIDLFLNAGMAVMVDFHADADYLNYYLSNPAASQELVDTWKMLAARYANRDPELLFFEVLNEPDNRFSQADWDVEQKKVLAGIRQVAPHHTVLLSATRWGGLDGLVNMTPYEDTNVIYTLHYYSPMTFTHQGADWTSPTALSSLRNVPWPAFAPELDGQLAKATDPAIHSLLEQYRDEDWDASRLQWDMSLAVAWAHKWDVRIILNEFGGYKPFSPPDARTAWLHDMMSALNHFHLAWTMWDYKGGFDLIDTKDGKRSLDPSVLSALGLAAWSTPAPVRPGPTPLFTGMRPVQIGGDDLTQTPGFAEAMLPADIDGDGRADLIATFIDWPALAPHAVRWFHNAGGGLLEPAKFDGPAPSGHLITAIVPGHFDRSGRPGYFLPDGAGANILLSQTGGSLRDDSSKLPLESAPTSGAVAGDVDGDGADDLVVFHPTGIELYRNDGTGHFSVDYRAFPAWMSNTSADDNHFTCGVFVHRDLIVFGTGATNGRVLINDGKGHFSDGALLPPPPAGSVPVPGGCAVQSGADVIVAWVKDTLQYLAGNGDGTYRDATAAHFAPLPASPNGLHRIALDGKTLVITRTSQSPLVETEDADGLFHARPPRTSAWPWAVVPADLNGDGRLDLVFGQGTDSSIQARFGN